MQSALETLLHNSGDNTLPGPSLGHAVGGLMRAGQWAGFLRRRGTVFLSRASSWGGIREICGAQSVGCRSFGSAEFGRN